VPADRPAPPALADILDYLPGGISMFDADLQMVFCNRAFRELLEFPDTLFADGLPHFRELMLFNARRGEYGPGEPEELADMLCARARQMRPHVMERTRPSGITIEVRGTPLPGGGFVSIYTDISERKRAEESAIRAGIERDVSRAGLAQVLGGSPVATFVLDSEHRVAHWNHACEVLTGLAAADLLGTCEQWRPFYSSPRPVMADLIIDGGIETDLGRHYPEKWQRSQLIEGAYEAEDYFPNVGDGGRWLYFTAAPLRDQSGRIVGAIETLQDVTARRRAEAALQEQAKQEHLRTSSYFQEVLSNLPFGVLVLDRALDMEFWNDKVEELFGLPEHFIRRGDSIRTCLYAIAQNGFYGAGDALEQAATRFERLARFETHAIEITRPGGRTILVRSSPVLIDGQPVGLILLQEDISARKQDEQRLREQDLAKSLAVLRHAIGNISQGISMVDGDLNLVVCNARFLELLDFPEHLGQPGTPFEEFIRFNAGRGEYGAGDIDALVRSRVEQARHAQAHVFERERPDGTIIEVVGKPLPDGGFITTYTDITERKRSELALREFNTRLEQKVAERTEALQKALHELGTVIENLQQTQDELIRSEKLASLGAMVAGIAHELNTPIGNSLMLATHMLASSQKMLTMLTTGMKRSTLEEFLNDGATANDVLVRNLHKAAELVASFKQVAVDQTSSQRRGFDLAEMVGEVVTALSPSLRKSQCQIVLDLAAEIRMDSYPGPLGQVITNLINNAMIHGFAGRDEGTVTLSSRLAVEQDRVALSVSDNGNGIPPHIQPRIFDPFFTTKLGQGGSGLGLNIVHNIVFGVLGGRISVASEPGGGTRFTLVLPLSAPAPETTAATAQVTPLAKHPPFPAHGRTTFNDDGNINGSGI
jgi:signal transduction histidine kinase/PAS domain-containing protein